ncbi:MAG: hypothetical protein GXO91_01220 [FCB group bacterium]|nr:hypothetical protein [FCB group bacterium]
MKTTTKSFLLLFLFTGTLVFGQSYFNPILGSDTYIGSGRAAAMGGTSLQNDRSSSALLFNPAQLSQQTNRLSLDYQFRGTSGLERRGYDLKDSFGDYLTTSDYVANRFSDGFHQGGLVYKHQREQLSFSGALAISPLATFNYRYEEEVRGAQSLQDGIIGIKDPLVGFQYLKSEGTLYTASFGGAVGFETGGRGTYSIGLGMHSILRGEVTQTVRVDTIQYDENYLADIEPSSETYTTPSDFFFSMGADFTILKGLQGAVAYESSARVTSGNAVEPAFNNESGLPEYLTTNPDYRTALLIQGVDYVKPSKLRVGLKYTPREKVPMVFAIEVETIYMSEKPDVIPLKDIKQWKFGFEYLALGTVPVRAGLIFREAPLETLSPESIFTFGAGKTYGHFAFDFAGQFSVLGTYDYPDLFPVSGEIRPDFDRVNESRFNLITTVNYGF